MRRGNMVRKGRAIRPSENRALRHEVAHSIPVRQSQSHGAAEAEGNISLALADTVEELLIFWPLFIAPRGVVDVFGSDGEVSGFGVGAELTELVFGCLLPLGG